MFLVVKLTVAKELGRTRQNDVKGLCILLPAVFHERKCVARSVPILYTCMPFIICAFAPAARQKVYVRWRDVPCSVAAEYLSHTGFRRSATGSCVLAQTATDTSEEADGDTYRVFPTELQVYGLCMSGMCSNFSDTFFGAGLNITHRAKTL